MVGSKKLDILPTANRAIWEEVYKQNQLPFLMLIKFIDIFLKSNTY